MMLIVGLGNPGQKYSGNRHNIGFMAVDEIARQHNFAAERARFQGLAMEGRLGGEKALILKPTTYMNDSGRAVAEAMRFYKIPLDDVVVFYDELDLAPGKVRVKKGGGLAGHNGLKSLKAHIGADFRRVRLGIGHPGHKDAVSGYVLRDFAKADHVWLDPLLDAIGQAAPLLTGGDDASFMNKVFLITNPEADRNTKKNAQDKKPEQE